MYNIDENKLQSIVENSNFSTEPDVDRQIKKSFIAFFSEMTNYTKSVNERILNNTLSNDHESVIPQICTAFLNKSDEKVKKIIEEVGLFPMDDSMDSVTNSQYTNKLSEFPESDYVYKRVFIDDEYDVIKNIPGDYSEQNSFIGEYVTFGEKHEFKYYLFFDRTFVKLHELLYKYALHYDIANPNVFSPYSYKSFILVFSKEIENEDLNFNFSNNGLNISEDGYSLLWNLKITEANCEIPYAKSPYGNEIRYAYRFNKSRHGNYLLPLPVNNQVKIFNIKFQEDFIEILVDRKQCDFTLLENFTIDLNLQSMKKLLSAKSLFSNSLTQSYNGIRNRRIVSIADIEHAIAPFRTDDNWMNCEISNGKGQIVKRYSSQYKASWGELKNFTKISRQYLKFDSVNRIKFKEDYINYVIQCLDYFYPEIEWAGEL